MAFTSGKISHDPEPWQHSWKGVPGIRTATPGLSLRHNTCPYCTPQYAPRTEFDNHNPILVEFRRSCPWDVAEAARIAAEWLEPPARPIPASASPEQIDHARRVLTKLAVMR